MQEYSTWKIVFSFLVFISLMALGCGKDEYDTDPGPTDIRIRNLSTKVYDSVEVNTSGGIQKYFAVNSGTYSDYKRFDVAYRLADITLYINSVKYTHGPVNYTFETWLGKGKYSYEVWISDSINHLLEMRVGNDWYELDD